MGFIVLPRVNKEGVTRGITGAMGILELVQANPLKCFLSCLSMHPGLVAPAMGT